MDSTDAESDWPAISQQDNIGAATEEDSSNSPTAEPLSRPPGNSPAACSSPPRDNNNILPVPVVPDQSNVPPDVDLPSGSGSASSTHDNFPQSIPSPIQQLRPRTRLQDGIIKRKQFTDGTIRYGNLCSTGEPEYLGEALMDPNWRKAMEVEYTALLKNNT